MDYVCGAEVSLLPVIDTRHDCRALTIGAIGAIGPLSDHYTLSDHFRIRQLSDIGPLSDTIGHSRGGDTLFKYRSYRIDYRTPFGPLSDYRTNRTTIGAFR